MQTESTKLYFKESFNTNDSCISDSILFTGKNIKWYNGSTGEITFGDTLTIKIIKSNRKINCYLGADSLFAFSITSDLMSSIVNDLVLNHKLHDGIYYFGNGYPGWIDNVKATTLRTQNKEKRADTWAKFIAQLKLEGRYKK
jgi:hypothetical protein